LLKQADIAMYQAKKAGRNTLCFYDPLMQTTLTERSAIENELYKAIECQQFELFFQLQVDQAYQPIGAETLLRWIHPDLGQVSPAQFIPLAEETGMILPIGQWVLESACAQLKKWQNQVGFERLTLSVNISAKQFYQANFVESTLALIQQFDINPAALKLELTEGMLLEDVEDIIAKMNALNQQGVSFSLDDFGTGYSSLQYLKRLPLGQLKIDQSFVRDIVYDHQDLSIVHTIIDMAKNLEMNVIAEGVETEDQRALLAEKGCENFQGYLFSKPIPIDDFESLLRETKVQLSLGV
jgi:EAL domain-containing protein (putative c-di-GMP-specific phosphodiesterase class I)